jgi:hypothetical protein
MPESYRDFEELSGPEQYAVARRYDGFSYRQIAAGLVSEFSHDRSEETVRRWFSEAKGGHLTQAYERYANQMGQEASSQARNLIRRAQPKAAASLVGLLDSQNDQVVHRAAVSVLGAVLEAPRLVDGPDEAVPVSGDLLREIEREREIIALGEKALSARELVKDAKLSEATNG